MTRTLFPDILSAYTVDIKNEIKKLHQVFFVNQFEILINRFTSRNYTLYLSCAESFITYKHRRTILTLEEFDNEFHFDRFNNVNKCPNGEELEYLVDFCEYVYNLLCNISFKYRDEIRYSEFVINHIEELCNYLNYVIHDDGNSIYYLVPSNGILDYVCNNIGNDITQLVRIYSHKHTKGDLAKKQQILSYLFKELEPKRNDLSKLQMNKIVNNVFSGANNCDVRHNNTDKEGKNYCASFAGIPAEEKESIYDNMFGNIIVLLSAKIEMEAINGLDNDISRINKK